MKQGAICGSAIEANRRGLTQLNNITNVANPIDRRVVVRVTDLKGGSPIMSKMRRTRCL